MTQDDRDTIRQWLENWAVAGAVLEQERFERIRNTNTSEAIEQLADAFEWALNSQPMRESSGMVEQQAYFKRLHGKQCFDLLNPL